MEVVGVAAIALAFVHALGRGLLQLGQKLNGSTAYSDLRRYLGKALLLGMEFLVGADIIRTVSIEADRESIESLLLLVAVRIILGWSISVEIEGCWPWLRKQKSGE
jgi:uncharacterized membrane protein